MRDAQQRREDVRHEVLQFLVSRPVLAFSSEAITRQVNRLGFDFLKIEVEEALTLLAGLQLISGKADGLGATLYYQATSKGILEHERRDA